MPFPQALDAFGKAFGIPVAADTSRKEHPFTADLLSQTKITVTMRDAEGYEVFETLLKMAFSEAQRMAVNSPVSIRTPGWTINDGVLVVLYPFDGDGVDEVYVTRIYDIRDFLAESRGTRDGISEDLVRLIYDNVVPETWRENGGMAKLQNLNGFLVISQTYANHYEVRRFLNALRHVGKGPATQPWRLP
jgi:hypothetical protein